MSLHPDYIQKTKIEAHREMRTAIEELSENFPDVVEAAASAVGGALGGAASFTALYVTGTVGLSAAGITSGLATAGTLLGGGMVAGIAVLAAPVAILGVVGYAVARNRKNARLAAALRRAIEKLHQIQERLIANAEYFGQELAEIKAYIEQFETRMP